MFDSELCKIFQNISFTKHLQATTSTNKCIEKRSETHSKLINSQLMASFLYIFGKLVNFKACSCMSICN